MAVLKTAVRLAHRGFESLPLRHVMLTRTLGSSRAAEGSLVLRRGRSPEAWAHLGALHEGRGLLDEGWVYSVGCGGSCSTHNPRPVPPEARGVAGRDVADCARGGGGGLRRRRPPGFLGLCWSWSALAGAGEAA